MGAGGMEISATDLLRTYVHASLQQLARKRGFDIKSKSKPALVSLVARTLYDGAAIAASLEDLEPVERDALDRLILMGGAMSTVVLRQQLEAEGKIDRQQRNPFGMSYQERQGSPSVRGSRKFEDIVARLGVLGLVFTRNPSPRNGNVELAEPGLDLFIPGAILRHLPPVDLPIETVGAPELEIPANPDALLRDVYVLLSFAQDQPIALTVKDQFPKRTLVQINAALRLPEHVSGVRSDSELGRLPFLRRLGEQLDLLAPSSGSLRLGDGAVAFLSRPPGERRKALYDAYCNTDRWTELSRIPDMSIWPRENMADPAVAKARRRVLAELAEMPPDQWIPVDHLVARMNRTAFEFLLPRSTQRHPYYGYGYYYNPDPYSGSNPLGLSFTSTSLNSAGWETVEGGFIRTVVADALSWLGVVDLGSSGDEPVSTFRITREGALLLQGDTPPSISPAPHVIIQPNFQVFAFDPTGEDVLFMLDRMAKRVRAEQVVEYHLTRESVYAAQRHGMETDEILAFLERVSSVPLPQNVRRSLEEWGAQHERIVVRRHVAMVHTIDEQTLDVLYADSSFQKLMGKRLAPTAAVIPSEHLDAIYAQLLAQGPSRGYPIPALSEGNDVFPHPILTVDATGLITFQQRLPSMYIHRSIQRFAEEEPDGTLRITAASLRRAARGDQGHPPLTAEDIISLLARFHRGSIPDETAAMIRRWAKDWGRGTLVEVVLLQVESEGTMADLLADPEIRPYLRPVPGALTLATINRDQAEHVRSLLKERGMTLGDRLPPAKKGGRSSFTLS